jgi:hypothetical protein
MDAAGPPNLDWVQVVKVALANRMGALLHHILADSGRLEILPVTASQDLVTEVSRLNQDAEGMSAALRAFLRKAADRGIQIVVHKGLWLSINVYKDPGMRPGGDIDLLVRKQDVGACLELLEEIGVGRYWPNLLDDRYYARHHLHQQRSTPDLKTWFEIHWALDHPYTLLTIDYEAMLDRVAPGRLLGEPVSELTPADRVVSLAVHLVKHAVYLPSLIEYPLDASRLARLILADGMLMYYLDVAETIRFYEAELDWEFLVNLGRQTGTVDMLGSVLLVCRELLETPIPVEILDALPVRGPGELARRAMRRVAEHELAGYLGGEPDRLWDFLVVTNGAFILRPIRALDLGAYLLPGRDYLQRRYGGASLAAAAGHSFRTIGQYARLAFDTLYFTWDRHRRLKSLGRSTSLFNRLENGPG